MLALAAANERSLRICFKLEIIASDKKTNELKTAYSVVRVIAVGNVGNFRLQLDSHFSELFTRIDSYGKSDGFYPVFGG